MVSIFIFSFISQAECLARWTDASFVLRIEGKFCGWDLAFGLLFSCLMSLAIFGFLIGKLGISTSELIVRDVAIDLVFMQILHVGFVGKAGICGYYDVSFI